MPRIVVIAILILFAPGAWAADGPRFLTPPYQHPKVVYEFYLDNPQKISAALHWIRALIKPLSEPPYSFSPEMMEIRVVMHGTEITTVVKKNYAKYKNAVDRMRYYSQLGVEFKVCALAAEGYGYRVEDFQDFIDVVPSAFTELTYWQMQGYALITPKVLERTQSVESIR